MTLRMLLLRITGNEPAAESERQRLEKNLVRMERGNRDLDQLTSQLAGALAKVDAAAARQHTSRPSGLSGEHRLNLPKEYLK